MLATLDRLIAARRFERILDLGTGSGVLAIALAKALRRRVLASDIDPVATHVARENAARNNVRPFVRVITAGGVSHPDIRRGAPYDLIVANILAEPLRRLAPKLVPLVARGGLVVLSGILLTNATASSLPIARRECGSSARTGLTGGRWSCSVGRSVELRSSGIRRRAWDGGTPSLQCQPP